MINVISKSVPIIWIVEGINSIFIDENEARKVAKENNAVASRIIACKW